MGKKVRVAIYLVVTLGLAFAVSPVVEAGYPYCCTTDENCNWAPPNNNLTKCCTPCGREAGCSTQYPNFCEAPSEGGHCSPCVE